MSGGGSILIVDVDIDKSDVSKFNRLIVNSTFSMCSSATHGGALGLINTASMRIVNTTFDSNSAQQQGGAIYFSCSNFQYDFDKCSLNITNSTFVNNVAN